MQINIYVTSDDYETLALNKPAELTTPQFLGLLIKNKAAQIRNTGTVPTTE